MKISQWKTKLLVTLGYLGVVFVFYIFELPCIFKALFGVACPGCGMSRAMFSVLKLDFVAAFAYHPMFWSIPILYIYFLLDNGIFKSKLWDGLVLGLIGAGFLINWIVNLL